MIYFKEFVKEWHLELDVWITKQLDGGFIIYLFCIYYTKNPMKVKFVIDLYLTPNIFLLQEAFMYWTHNLCLNNLAVHRSTLSWDEVFVRMLQRTEKSCKHSEEYKDTVGQLRFSHMQQIDWAALHSTNGHWPRRFCKGFPGALKSKEAKDSSMPESIYRIKLYFSC